MSCMYDTYYCPRCNTSNEVEQRQTGFFCSSCGKYYTREGKEVEYNEINLSTTPFADTLDKLFNQ